MSLVPVDEPRLKLTEAEIVQRFDELVARGVVQYDPEQRIERVTDRGLEFEFRVSTALAKKPGFGVPAVPVPAAATNEKDGQDGPAPPPAGDIEIRGFEVEDISDTHVLAFNRFAAHRPHLMILTLDPTRKQTELLDERDLRATWSVLQSLGDRYLALYNCGPVGGCSRSQKHVQVIAHPEGRTLWPDQQAAKRARLPFLFYEKRLGGPDLDARLVSDAYGEMMERTRRALGVPEGEHVPHNVVLSRDWLVVIPRTHAGLLGVNANAVSMLGIVWLADDHWLERWMRGGGKGPMDVVEHCCLKADGTVPS